MTLTVCVGSSGSGKTTFLNDVHKSHKCTYIRQYHSIRPYITVSKIPNFDPTKLPYWDIYTKEEKTDTIKVGGTMAGEFTAGLSGGQRKLLLFELIYQRTMNQSKLLICLDEPFAGVTDDFVPFIVGRLNLMREKHNILLVTNDHVETLTRMSDNTITVSAIDRTTVKVNDHEKVNRDKALLALSLGDDYVYNASGDDLRFFWDTEVSKNVALLGIALFTAFLYTLFLPTFWDSNDENAVLILLAGDLISFFCINPYLLSLVDWRIFMLEEAEALVHASKGVNKTLKSCLAIGIILLIALTEYGCVNAVVDGLESPFFFAAMFLDQFSMTAPLLCLAIFTSLPLQAVQIFGFLPYMFMIFFSTTYSPGSGVPFLKEFRYLFTRFYFWCKVPVVDEVMEGCPPDNLNILYLLLTGVLGVFLFCCMKLGFRIRSSFQKAKEVERRASYHDKEYHLLQKELYAGKRRLGHEKRKVVKHLLGGSSSTSTIGKRTKDTNIFEEEKEEEGCDVTRQQEPEQLVWT